LFDRPHPRWTIAGRELSSLSREKTIVLAILIQLFIAAFSSFLVVGLTSMYDPGSVRGGEITVGVTGEKQNELVRAASGTEGVEILAFPDRAGAVDAFDRGAVDAVLVGRSDRGRDGTRIEVNAVVPAEDLRTTLIVVQVREVLTELERSERITRVDHLEFTPVPVPGGVDASPYFSFTYTVLLPVLLFLPPFISGSIVVDSVTEEIERGTLELLRAAPVSLVDVVDGKAAAMVGLAPVQAVLWLALLRLNGIAVDHVLPLLVFVTAIATVVVVVGLGLGLLTGQRRQAQLLYSVLVLLLFGAATLLPEHPATTVAKLAVDSPTAATFSHVAGFAALAVATYALARRSVGRLSPETL